MKTNFTSQQLADPQLAEADRILRACVHCGFCTATCPTYVITGDERDSPRGRIYMMQEMLEQGGKPSPETVKHVDRCLSCLSCMTTCPSGVHYMHLADQARAYIEKHYERPGFERLLRFVLNWTLTTPMLLRVALKLAKWIRFLAPIMPKPVAAMLRMAPDNLPDAQDFTGTHMAKNRQMRVALLTGCAQSVIDPEINASTIRLLNRFGVEIVVPEAQGCCGALSLHLGKTEGAKRMARANVKAWEQARVDHVIVNTSGCGTVVKDYGHLIGQNEIAAKTLDVSELLARLQLPKLEARHFKIAYHSACSLQHGQKVTGVAEGLLRQAGFDLVPVAEGHMCCGSAGTYNMLQPEMAAELGKRKRANLTAKNPDAIVAGNLGCITQIAQGLDVPVLHLVELLDWAYGGPKPAKLERG